MQDHTKIYFAFFGYQIPSDCLCEICGVPAVDLNHIQARGMGGNPAKDKNKIENLMAMCRGHHLEYGDVPEYRPLLVLVHLKYMFYKGRRDQLRKLSPSIEKQIESAESAVKNQPFKEL